MYSMLMKTELFKGFREEEIEIVLRCLKSEVKKYKKGQVILTAGDSVTQVGILISGSIMVYQYDMMEEISQTYTLKINETFGHEEIYSKNTISRCTYLAQSDTEILYIDGIKLTEEGAQNCKYRAKMNINMLGHFAKMNTRYHEIIELRNVKSLKKRICLFLYYRIQAHNQKLFYISQNREEMAEYLGATRPAVSNTLRQLKAEGIIDYYKNSFSILDREKLVDVLNEEKIPS